jgi:tryptophan synthase beta chain
MAPLVSHAVELGLADPIGIPQLEAFAAGVAFAKAEGILPAPEANHAVAGAFREAERCKREGKSEVILFNLCGHGHFDMAAYQAYVAGDLMDYEYPEEEIAMALAGLPLVGN